MSVLAMPQHVVFRPDRLADALTDLLVRKAKLKRVPALRRALVVAIEAFAEANGDVVVALRTGAPAVRSIGYLYPDTRIAPEELRDIFNHVWRLVGRDIQHVIQLLPPQQREHYRQRVRAYLGALRPQALVGQEEMRAALALPVAKRHHDLVEALLHRERSGHLIGACGLTSADQYRPIVLVRGQWPARLVGQSDVIRSEPIGMLLVPAEMTVAELKDLLTGGIFVSSPARPLATIGGSIAMALSARETIIETPPAQVHRGLITCGDVLPELMQHQLHDLAQLTAEKHLAKLEALSGRRRSMYAETMLAWLEHHGSLEALAKSVGLAPQTMRDRVAKCQELLGDSAEDPVIRLALILALRGRVASWRLETQPHRRGHARGRDKHRS